MQSIPRTGPEREALREKGQFWTPAWVAEAMVSYVLIDNPQYIFDPAVGEGAFIQATQKVIQARNYQVKFCGREIDESALELDLLASDLVEVGIGDFVFDDSLKALPAIVANPPYIRHHRLDSQLKKDLRQLAKTITDRKLDGRTGYHVFFLIRALSLLAWGGRLAFIVPADVVEGVSAYKLWQWIAKNYRIDGVVTFEPEATPFPGVDTNPIILLIRNLEPIPTVKWAKCKHQGTDYLTTWLTNDLAGSIPETELCIKERELDEALEIGLSRPPSHLPSDTLTLGDFALVQRGIATGANDFFLFTPEQAKHKGIPEPFLIPFIGRTRDVPDDEITLATMENIRQKDRPTFLLSLHQQPKQSLPLALQKYLEQGEAIGLPDRPLISQRNPWYKMERRDPPPILFAYLGRRNTRFIRNRAGVVPLTCFLCIYPFDKTSTAVEKLWQALNDPETLSYLPMVAKSYGGGAIKAEPRSLERLPIPKHILQKYKVTLEIKAKNSLSNSVKSQPGFQQLGFDFED